MFNKKKELIGVNTFTTAKAENLNFAVSVDDLVEFINEVQQEEVDSQYIKKKKKGIAGNFKIRKVHPKYQDNPKSKIQTYGKKY